MSNDSRPETLRADEYFGLLDAIVVVAEVWKELVVACILAAAIGFGYYQIQPKVYESQAVVVLDPVQLARFSAPDFLERTGVDRAMWSLDLSHMNAGEDSLSASYLVSFRAGSPAAAQTGLDGVIQAFKAETAPDAAQTELLQRSKARILKAIDDLDLISSRLVAEAQGTIPRSESDAYARSVAMLLDQQAKRENELLDVELKLKGSSDIVVTPPSLPTSALERSLRAVIVASVGIAVFLVLCFAFGREAVRRAARTSSGSQKLLRLRQALKWRRS
ncbi:hypothetical protein JI749_13370 [Devosia oryziradicis]|uniref:Polysaccharide chain length determinant N-terminal domain-containing protein n=1 Tax=Devosia oryziradicis TaxID=2801335 RepID=A0ABX7BWA0_9HYPH|nr:hypothetical protein [Devosia oryziradicis]QQR35339.1 hypothetical protein JI749_13370 [Devosia oryziradicis]